MKLFKSNPGIFALVAGILLAGSLSAFTAGNTGEYWQLKPGSNIIAAHESSSYDPIETPASGCVGTALPCVVDITGYADLDAFLAANTSDEDLLDNAVSRRN